jgi:DNA-binding CsgD family transcriptional regulator
MELQREALDIAEQIGSRRHCAIVRLHMGTILQIQGDTAGAMREIVNGMTVLWDLGALNYLTVPLERLAELVTASGDPIQAARFLGAATSLRASLGEQVPPSIEEARTAAIEVTRAATDEEAFAAAFAEGEAAPLEEIVREIERVQVLAEESGVDPVTQEVAQRTGLTLQEVRALRLFAAGRSNAEIAAELAISLPVATAQIGRLYTKLGVDSRAALTAIAFKHGLV